MRLTNRAVAVSISLLLAGCAVVKHESYTLSNGSKVDYIHGKVDADGQTGVFRDAWVDGKPVLSHFGSGQSLLGQVLQGTASSAMIAGGMVGGAALLRPARYNSNETNNLDNNQLQAQSQSSESTSVAISESAAKATNKNYNHNYTHTETKISEISGSGVPGCEKAKFGC